MPDQPDFIVIKSDRIAARINPLGAELWSLTDARGREFMTDADPAFWTGHAPLLFPIVGELRGGRYRIGPDEYALERHGFARKSLFEVMTAEEGVARLRLLDTAQTRAVYPFSFILEVEYRAEGDVLREVVTVTNPGEGPLWFSQGFHPAFAWPLPGGAAKEDHRVVFAEPENAPVRRLDRATGLMLPETFPNPVEGRVLTPTSAMFEPDVLMFDRLNSRSLTYGADGGSRLEIGFPDSPILGLWQKPGAPFLCIEPWQGIADPADWDGDFRVKPGVVELAPNASRSFRMDVRVVSG